MSIVALFGACVVGYFLLFYGTAKVLTAFGFFPET